MSRQRVVTVAADLVGVVLFGLATWATVASLWQAINFYDEGLLLTNANNLLLGAAPYRDFYSNYPPGVFVLLAAVWKVIGVHAVVERWLALSFHLGIALLAGHLAGRIAGRRFVRKCRSTCASSPRRIARPRMPRKTWTSTIGQDEEEWILPAGFDVERDAVV